MSQYLLFHATKIPDAALKNDFGVLLREEVLGNGGTGSNPSISFDLMGAREGRGRGGEGGGGIRKHFALQWNQDAGVSVWRCYAGAMSRSTV